MSGTAAAAQTGGVDLHQLRCFLAVVEEGNFGRAAERLHLTPSPVSRAVRELERDLGTPLFVRGHHTVALTEAGQLLAERGAAVVRGFDRLKPDVQRLAVARAVRLGGCPTVATDVLDAVVECAAKARPASEPEVQLGSTEDLLGALERGELDVAVVHLPVEAPGLAARVLVRYPMCAAMRADDVLAGRPALTLADLRERTLAMLPPAPRSGTIPQLRAALEGAGVTRLRVLPDDDILRLAEHVRRTGEPTPAFVHAAGAAARVLSDPAFVLVPVSDGPSVDVGVTWRADREGDDIVDAVLAELGNRFPAAAVAAGISGGGPARARR